MQGTLSPCDRKGRKYYVYRYEGNLNGIENAVVLLSYPAKSFGKEKALRAFISTNAALSDEEILDLYVVRWEIEVYFRDCKMKLAVDKYQIRSANGIKHFWLIASLAYMIACFESKRYNFSEGYHLLSQTIRREQVSFIFDYAQNGRDKSALFGEYCLTTFVHFHENGVGMLIYSSVDMGTRRKLNP